MRIALIVPYFGKLPDHFQLLLRCCEANKDMYDWIFFTDDHAKYHYPENVKVHYFSFEQIRKIVQSRFDFPISLLRPYKFCDLKPMYGYIFQDYLKGYNYWGHCDIDCIYGHFSNFINEIALTYDKILRLGHLTLYKNTEENNTRFMEPINGVERYKEVLQSNYSCLFDEDNAKGYLCIEDIWRKYGYSEYRIDDCIANVGYKHSYFKLHYQKEKSHYIAEKKKRAIFFWNEGKLLRFYLENGNLRCREYAYIHMMARKMKNKVSDSYDGPFKIIPNAFEPIEKLPESVEEFNSIKWKHFNLQYIKVRSKNLKNKIKQKLGMSTMR